MTTVDPGWNRITKAPRSDPQDGCPSNRCSGSKLISLCQERDCIPLLSFNIISLKLAMLVITTINALLHGEQIVQMAVPLQNM